MHRSVRRYSFPEPAVQHTESNSAAVVAPDAGRETDVLRRLPPLNALKAFEAAARSESFTRAAEELCVTQGAVSHQVKALEATLGVRLFNRERQRLPRNAPGRE